MASKEKDWLTCSMESIGAELIRIATDRKQRAEEKKEPQKRQEPIQLTLFDDMF